MLTFTRIEVGGELEEACQRRFGTSRVICNRAPVCSVRYKLKHTSKIGPLVGTAHEIR